MGILDGELKDQVLLQTLTPGTHTTKASGTARLRFEVGTPNSIDIDGEEEGN